MGKSLQERVANVPDALEVLNDLDTYTHLEAVKQLDRLGIKTSDPAVRRFRASFPKGADRLGRIADLLERNGIDIDDVGSVEKVKLWQGFYKDADGESHTVDLAGVQLSPTWAEGPRWPLVNPARPDRKSVV